jgi:SAM-dependent methyltransferase
MNKLFNLVKWGITLGSGSQNFLGAKWISKTLDRTRTEKQRLRALRILSLSPHYFIDTDNPAYAEMSNREYLEAAFDIYKLSREKLMDQVLSGRVGRDDVVLDYGCGPGFLAKAVAANVKHIYAADISNGALACARILNSADNLDYVVADESGLNDISNATVDTVISFAVIQHISDDIYKLILANCWRKLKPGGRLLIQIQLLEAGWRTEEEWKADRSFRGKLKFRYGLHCFGRTAEAHLAMVRKLGFVDAKVESIADLVTEKFDDICSQHLLTARKPD